MKNKNRVIFIIGLLILFSLGSFAETKKLKDVGRYKLMNIKAGLSTEEVMKTITEKYAEDIKSGFALAGYSDLFLPFMEMIKQSAFREKELASGDKMMWMIFRSQGKINVVYDLEWAGQEPLPVYAFSIKKEDKNYELIMPKSCGNISLLNVEVVPSAKTEGQPPSQEQEERYQIRKAKIYEDKYNLLHEVDLYCSFSIWENEIPDLKIVGAPREKEKIMFSDGDTVFLNKGKNDQLEQGQIFMIVQIADYLPDYGRIALKKGRARIVALRDTVSVAVIENSCGDARIGHYLVPFEPRDLFLGKDLGYDVPPIETDGVKGKAIYLQGDYNQIGSGHWALVNLGAGDGIRAGDQLILYRKIRQDLPVQIFGNSVVIDVQTRTSTIKVLSCRDALHKNDLVMVRPPQ
jgi:hypothetical protein